MSKKDILKHEPLGEDKKSLGYYAVKYTVFLTPPLAIFLTLYYFLRDIAFSLVGTFIVLVIGIIAMAVWYKKRTGESVIREDD